MRKKRKSRKKQMNQNKQRKNDMKKILTVIFCLLLMVMMTLPVLAAPEVKFTSDSKFVPGGKITVDILTMTDMDSIIHEAWLEGDVVYHWYVDGVENPELSGKSITLLQEHVGHTIHVEVVCYDLTVVSQRYLITNAVVVTTKPTTSGTSTAATTTAPTTEPSSAPTEPSTAPATQEPTTVPATTQPPATSQPGQTTDAPASEGSPWWGIVLIALASAIIGGVVAMLLSRKKK